MRRLKCGCRCEARLRSRATPNRISGNFIRASATTSLLSPTFAPAARWLCPATHRPVTNRAFLQKTRFLAPPDATLARDDIGHLVQPPSQEKPHIVDDQRHDEVLIFGDITADMRRDKDIRQRPERALRRQ